MSSTRNPRHPEWYPDRPLCISFTVSTAMPYAHQALLLEDVQARHAPDFVTRHDTKRRGALPWCSWYEVKFAPPAGHGAPVDCFAVVRSRRSEPGALAAVETMVDVSVYRASETAREATPAGLVYAEALRQQSGSADPSAAGVRFCNNPDCAVTRSGHGARCKKCSLCHTAEYCSKRCQTEHWRAHRPECRALRVRYRFSGKFVVKSGKCVESSGWLVQAAAAARAAAVGES
jgi:hypothetical protein